MAASSSNLVCVQIKLKNEPDPLRPVVRKRTRGHEVVEIPGQNFMFTRKRKQPPAPPADAEAAEDQAPSPLKAAAADAELDADAAMADQDPANPAAADADAAGEEQPAPAAAAAESSAAPTAFTTPTGELLEIVRWAVFNELQQQPAAAAAGPSSSDPEHMVAVADGVATRLAEQLVGSSSGGGGNGGGAGCAGNGVGLQCLMVLPHQVDRLKATLLEKRDMLLQEEAAWLRLKETYTTSQGTGTTAAAEAAGVEGEEVEGQGLGEVVMEDAGVEGAEEVPADHQQQQPAQEGVRGGRPTMIPESPTPAAAAGEAAAEGAAAEGATAKAGGGAGREEEEGAGGGGPVCVARGVALTRVGLQVEALVGMVAKVEQLVTAAEEASRDLQATFHRERFQVFPHVNSPALLIKTIINPSQTSGAGAGDA